MMKYLLIICRRRLREGYAEDSVALAELVICDLRAGDVVTVKGSFSMHMHVIIDRLKALGDPLKDSEPHKLAS